MKITGQGLNILAGFLQKPNEAQQDPKAQRKQEPVRLQSQFQVRVQENNKFQRREKVQISNRFREVLKLKEQVMTQASPLREEKVAQAKAAIAEGKYQVNAKGTAAKLLQNVVINSIYNK